MEMNDKRIRVLLIEDNPGDVRLIQEMLSEDSRNVFEIVHTDRLSKGLEFLKGDGIDILLLDLGLPDSRGIDTLHAILFNNNKIPIIIQTGLSDEDIAIEAVKAGAQDYLIKGQMNSCLLSRSIRYAIERKLEEDKLRSEEQMFRTLAEQSSDIIVLVNRERVITYENPAVERTLGFKPEERIGSSIFERVHPDDLNIVIDAVTTLEKNTNASVQRAEVRLQHKDGSWRTYDAVGSTLVHDAVIEGGIINLHDITDRKITEDRIRKALEATVQAIAVTVETRDPYTAGHQRRVADLARAIATDMSLPADIINGISMAATIHDLGKISIPSEILSKPRKLTDIEFSIIKIHPQAGYDILKDIDFPWPVARIVLEHHERVNGSGYPSKLIAEKTLLESRILAVADVVESMASHRPYRPSLGIEAALEEIKKNRGILYDNKVVDACLKLFLEKGFQLITLEL
jgi:PAS domain S-box-containing protein